MNTDPKLKTIFGNSPGQIDRRGKRYESFWDYIFALLSDSEKFFSLFVITATTSLSSVIILKEAFTKEILFYELPEGYIFRRIPSYTISILFMFISCLMVIHVNKILLQLNSWLGIHVDSKKLDNDIKTHLLSKRNMDKFDDEQSNITNNNNIENNKENKQ